MSTKSQWHHVAVVTKDGPIVKAYLDGNEVVGSFDFDFRNNLKEMDGECNYSSNILLTCPVCGVEDSANKLLDDWDGNTYLFLCCGERSPWSNANPRISFSAGDRISFSAGDTVTLQFYWRSE